MSARRPPRAAMWMLEHLAPGDANDALAGDLLEEFESGRSDAWYWRQAMAAVAIRWLRYLEGRRTVVVFAALWSMLAPAWTAIVYRLETSARFSEAMWRMDGPFNGFPSFAIWLGLNLAFVWAGMLFYFALSAELTSRGAARSVAAALAVATPMFLGAYFATFVLVNLFAYPGPAMDLRGIAPLAAIVDMRAWALIVRIPFFITLICALWKAAPIPLAAHGVFGAAAIANSGATGDSAFSTQLAEDDAFFAPRMVIAGCISAVLFESLLCFFPIDGILKAIGAIPAAAFYTVEAVFAGAAGAVLFGSPPEMRSWRRFFHAVLTLGPAWVWVPPAVLLWYQNSVWALPAAATGATMIAICLHGAGRLAAPADAWLPFEERELFAEALQPIPWDWHAAAISVCLYAAFVAYKIGVIELACVAMAFAAFLFAAQRVRALQPSLPMLRRHGSMRRLVRAALPAVFVTLVILLVVSRHPRPVPGGDTASAAESSAAKDKNRQDGKNRASGFGFAGYQSIVLWPFPPKQEIVAPLPPQSLLLEPHAARPLVIRFNGAYWYFQPPETGPGLRAHIAHGSPLDANIRATDFLPVMMEAHQSLGAPIRVSHCREIEVTIENSDNMAGSLAIGVVLTDGGSPGKPTLFLGEQPLATHAQALFTNRLTPAEETLRFEIPARAKLRRFDEITLIVDPDIARREVGSKIAVDQLAFYPR